MNNKVLGYIFISLILLQGCIANTLPTVKKLEKGERITGFSVGLPVSTAAGIYPSWSIYYGRGIDDKTDQYTFLGDDAGIGVFFNRKVNGRDYSYTTMNLGICLSPVVRGLLPKLGFNYSEGEKDRQNIGFLVSVYPISSADGKWKIDGTKLHLYLGSEHRSNNSYFERRIGIYRLGGGKSASTYSPSFEYLEGSKK